MNPSAVAHADTISAPTTKCGDVSATAKRMGIISDMLQTLHRFARNGKVKNDGKRSNRKITKDTPILS